MATVVHYNSIISAITGYAFLLLKEEPHSCLQSSPFWIQWNYLFNHHSQCFLSIFCSVLLCLPFCSLTRYVSTHNGRHAKIRHVALQTSHFLFWKPGCGLKDFQIYCINYSRPVLLIDSTNYTMIDDFENMTCVMAAENNLQICPRSLNSIFTSDNCLPTRCAPYEQLLGSVCSSSQPNVYLLTVHWDSSKDIETCQTCEKSGGYCSNSDSGLVCFYRNGTRSYLNSKGIFHFNSSGPSCQ